MSASERQTFARKKDREVAFDLVITAASDGDRPRPFVVAFRADDGVRGMLAGSFREDLQPDELRILARLLVAMAGRCDAANEALARGEG